MRILGISDGQTSGAAVIEDGCLVAAVNDLASRREEIIALYEPMGSNGYRHKEFEPPAMDIFDPERMLQRFLGESAQTTAG